MSTPDDIIASFVAATDTFGPVVDAPIDNNVDQICRIVVDLFQSFCYHGSQDSLSRFIEL